jgi:hypothetical protein
MFLYWKIATSASEVSADQTVASGGINKEAAFLKRVKE